MAPQVNPSSKGHAHECRFIYNNWGKYAFVFGCWVQRIGRAHCNHLFQCAVDIRWLLFPLRF